MMRKISLRQWIILSLVLFANLSFAQDKKQFSLLDQDSFLPIEGAAYIYGNQQGVTDEQGVVKLQNKDDQNIQFSHLNYDKWELQVKELEEAFESGVIYRQSVQVNLYPVTVIALRSKEAPSNCVRMDYRDKMSHDASTILAQTPSFSSIKKSGGYGFDPVFRGFKYDQLNIVLNGAQTASAACPNRMDPPTSQMAPNMLDRIELLKGPYALRYGSGFGATINFIPASLRFSEQNKVYSRVSGGYESNGNLLRSEAQVGMSGKAYDLSLFGAYSQGDDYQSGSGQLIQSDFQRSSFGSNLGIKLSNKQQLRLSGTYNIARDVDFPGLMMDLRSDDTWLLNARHDMKIYKEKLKSWNTTVYASLVNHLMDNLSKPMEPRIVNAETDATTRNYGGKTESQWMFGEHTLFAGADFRLEGAAGIRSREFLMGPMAGKTVEDNVWQDSQIGKTAVFAEYHHELDQNRLVFSGRAEYNSASLNDPAATFTSAVSETSIQQFNPGFSAGIVHKFNEDANLGLWLGRVQRSGGLTERFINYFPVGNDPYELLGNPGIEPEVNNQLDVNVNLGKEQTLISFDVFASYLQDHISSRIDSDLNPRIPSSPGVRRFVNIGQAFKTGFEFSLTQQLFAGLSHNLSVAYTYAQDLERDEPLPEIAPMDFRYTLKGSYFNDKLKPVLRLRHVLEQSRISAEYGETTTPAFTLVDVHFSWQPIEMMGVTAGVSNLFNVNYNEHLTRFVSGMTSPIYARGRSVFVSMNLRF